MRVLLVALALLLAVPAAAAFRADILSVADGGGPYAYVILQDGVGETATVGAASISAAVNGARDSIGVRLAGATVRRMTWTVTTNNAALTFTAAIMAVSDGGPYAYVVQQNGTGTEAGSGIPTITAVMNAVRDDISARLAGATVRRVTWGVTLSTDP